MSANQPTNPTGQQALRQQVGDRFYADWKSNDCLLYTSPSPRDS